MKIKNESKTELLGIASKGKIFPLATPFTRVKSRTRKPKVKSEKVVLRTMKDLNGKHGTPRKLARAKNSKNMIQMLETKNKNLSDTFLMFCLMFGRQNVKCIDMK